MYINYRCTYKKFLNIKPVSRSCQVIGCKKFNKSVIERNDCQKNIHYENTVICHTLHVLLFLSFPSHGKTEVIILLQQLDRMCFQGQYFFLKKNRQKNRMKIFHQKHVK